MKFKKYLNEEVSLLELSDKIKKAWKNYLNVESEMSEICKTLNMEKEYDELNNKISIHMDDIFTEMSLKEQDLSQRA